MYCKKCGSPNEDNAWKCVKCGEPLQAPPAGGPAPSIPNYLVPAILVTVFCCLPGGIAAIVYAAQVNGKIAAGDIAGAQDSSKKAKMWSLISAGVGLAGVVLYVIFMVIVAAAAHH